MTTGVVFSAALLFLLPTLICFLCGYFLGNLNGALICAKLFHHEDIRKQGSGNAGLTNYFRTYHSWDTLLVILIDAGKAVLACFIGKFVFQAWPVGDEIELLRFGSMICGGAAVVGHCFPIFYGFRGGKGILSCGALSAYMNIWVFLILLAVFALAVLLSKRVSVGSMTACVVYPFLFWLFFPQNIPVVIIAAITAALDIFMHRPNIANLIHGTEPKITFQSKEKNL